MRHNKAHRRLSRDSSHRKAMLRNMSVSLLENEQIETTVTRAKELRKVVEKLITLGKKGALHNKRRVFALTRSAKMVMKLFDDIAPRYMDRNGGYTRIIRTAVRRGDSSMMAIIELV